MTRRSPTYGSWEAMRARCLQKRNKDYPNYGGRGITICDRWNVFENFLADMGERPEGMTLERRKTSDGYHAGNCMWATSTDQLRNRRDRVRVTIGGVTKLMVDWARENGIPLTTVSSRIAAGWPADLACTKPSRPKANHPKT